MAEARALEDSLAPKQWSRPTATFLLGSGLVFLGVLLGVSQLLFRDAASGAGGVGPYLLLAVVCVGIGSWLAWSCRLFVRSAARTGVIVAAFVILGLGGVGYATQITVDGVPVLNTSTTAQAARDASAIERDLLSLVGLDELLAADLTITRTQLSELAQHELNAQEIRQRWAARDINSFANPTLGESARALAVAADWGAQAAEAKRQIAVQYDARRAQNLETMRASFVSNTLRSGQLLNIGAGQAGVPVGAPEGVRE